MTFSRRNPEITVIVTSRKSAQHGFRPACTSSKMPRSPVCFTDDFLHSLVRRQLQLLGLGESGLRKLAYAQCCAVSHVQAQASAENSTFVVGYLTHLFGLRHTEPIPLWGCREARQPAATGTFNCVLGSTCNTTDGCHIHWVWLRLEVKVSFLVRVTVTMRPALGVRLGPRHV